MILPTDVVQSIADDWATEWREHGSAMAEIASITALLDASDAGATLPRQTLG